MIQTSKFFIYVLFISQFLNPYIQSKETINGAGATFPYPLYALWADQYNKATGVKINYQPIGSGGGIRQITDHTVDFGASDDPLTPELLQKSKLLQFPAVIGAVVPVVNVKGVKAGDLKLDANSLSNIFLGKILYWDDPQIKKLNQDLALPHEKITVITRADPSGTNALFTKYLNDTNSDWYDQVGTGKAVRFPVGISGRGNTGLANLILTTEYSIGYVEYAYALQNKLVYVQLKNQDGHFVTPTYETFQAAAETEKFHASNDFYSFMINAPGEKSWPISGATFILLAKEKTDKNKEVVKFFDWAFQNGDDAAKKLIYVPLPKSLIDKVRDYWKKNGLL
jgi:phosphate transport system substrate-binding protein